jgi:hypothetical protein
VRNTNNETAFALLAPLVGDPENFRCFVYSESVFNRSLHRSGLSLCGSGLRVFWVLRALVRSRNVHF